VEEGPVEDGRGEVESVLERKIERVDGLGRHPPFTAIDRTAKLGELMMIFPLLCSPGVAQRIVAADHEPSVVAPRLRVTDTNTQRFELGFCLRFGRGRNPAQGIDAT